MRGVGKERNSIYIAPSMKRNQRHPACWTTDPQRIKQVESNVLPQLRRATVVSVVSEAPCRRGVHLGGIVVNAVARDAAAGPPEWSPVSFDVYERPASNYRNWSVTDRRRLVTFPQLPAFAVRTTHWYRGRSRYWTNVVPQLWSCRRRRSLQRSWASRAVIFSYLNRL